MRIPYKKLFGFVSVAGLLGFDKKGLVETRYIGGSDDIDKIKTVCGNYIYWGGSIPQGTFPITMGSTISLLLFTRFTGGMGFQTLYTGVVGMGSLTHKYERVYTDKWGAWKDMGSVNSPH